MSTSTITFVLRAVRALVLWSAVAAGASSFDRVSSASTSEPGTTWTLEEERWYELTLGGRPCGSLETRIERSGDKGSERFRTTTVTRMTLSRGADNDVTVMMESVFIESGRGVPESAFVRQSTGGEPTVLRASFERDGEVYRVVLEEGTGSRTETIPAEGWLAPRAVEEFVRQRMTAGAREIAYRALDLEGGLRINAITMKRGGIGNALVDETSPVRQVPVAIWTTTSDAMPVPSTDRFDNAGRLVDSTAKLGIGELRTRRTSREKAQAAAAARGAEVLVKSFVPAPKSIAGAMESTRLRLRVRALEGPLVDLPTTGAQIAVRVDASTIELDVDVERGSRATPEERAEKRFREPSGLIDVEHPAVQRLIQEDARRNADRVRTERERAEDLRRLVYAHIGAKNLESAFASASHAASTRSGDCSEHAVLLAALLRGVGTPARIASGLVYADRFAGGRDVWAWHVWTQAMLPVEGGPADAYEWVDFDATLPVRHHAAHVATAVGDLSAGATDPMWTSALGLLGNIGIEVVEDAKIPASSR
jgi:transglutaminase-like putative cysteine protease